MIKGYIVTLTRDFFLTMLAIRRRISSVLFPWVSTNFSSANSATSRYLLINPPSLLSSCWFWLVSLFAKSKRRKVVLVKCESTEICFKKFQTECFDLVFFLCKHVSKVFTVCTCHCHTNKVWKIQHGFVEFRSLEIKTRPKIPTDFWQMKRMTSSCLAPTNRSV